VKHTAALRKNPKTEEELTQEEIKKGYSNIKVGDSLKVWIDYAYPDGSIGSESFWTRVAKVKKSKIIAYIDNELFTTYHGCKLFDKIEYKIEHVFDFGGSIEDTEYKTMEAYLEEIKKYRK